MNHLKEEDFLPAKSLAARSESNGYGQAVNDLWDLMDKMGVDSLLRSEIFACMVAKYSSYGRPVDQNAYDKLNQIM